MKSYEALQKPIKGKTTEFSRALCLSNSLINKWQEPSTDYTDSGASNPLDRIEAIIEKSFALGHSTEDSIAPINYLCERFKLITIPLEIQTSKDEISQEFFHSIKEFGDLAKETSEALKDGSLTSREAKAIDKEGWETIREIAAFVAKVKEAARREHGQNR